MAGYTKLSSSLVTSTVWRESSPTRCVWITMLALADAHGEVQASVPGLADVSRVSIEECEHALSIFLSPDKYSRTQNEDGRRITPIDGGWVLLNYSKYRDLLSMEHRRSLGRERARRFRKKEEVTQSNANVTPNNDKQYAEAEAKADSISSSSSADVDRLIESLPTPVMRTAWWAEIAAARHGMHGEVLTAEQIAIACRDYVANGHTETPSLRHFRAYLASAGRPRGGKPQNDSARPRLSKQEIGRQNLENAIARRAPAGEANG